MILPRYRIAPSRNPGAGQGLYLEEPVRRGRIVVAPDAIPATFGWDEVRAQPDPSAAMAAARHLVGLPLRTGLVKRLGDYAYWNTAWLDPVVA